MVPLERLFDKNDVFVKLLTKYAEEDTINYNVGTDSEPKLVKVSKALSNERRQKYVDLMKEFDDVFAWRYEDIKTYDTSIIQHKIPLKPNTNPFKYKLRHVNPILLPIIEKEVKKLLNEKIIVPFRFYDWVANLVLVRKENREIRLCVDFRNFNRCYLNDDYPLLKMDHIMQKVVGAKRISMIDGFSGYNQVATHDDKEKIAFTTPWGTFVYDKIPFGLMNAGATVQRAIDILFVGENDEFIVIYLDDITIFS